MRMVRSRLLVALSLALCAVAITASAQTNSTTSTVTLNAVLAQSISVTARAASYSWAALTPGGSTTAAAPVTLTTTWVLSPSVGHVELDAYFATPAHAMTDGSSDYIPASAIFGAVSGADTVASTALTSSTTLGPANAGLTIFTHTLTTGFSSSRADVLTLSIDLTSLAIPAGTYTGTLTFQAQAL